MNKDIIKQITGFDIHVLTQDNRNKTVSYFGFINPQNAFLSINNVDSENLNLPFPEYSYLFNLRMECKGFDYEYFDKVERNRNHNMMAKIKDVNIIVPNKVVEVTFTDGTKEKSVCREPDTFSLESAISICISKKIMGGSGAYNNAVKRGVKVYQDKLNKEAEEKDEQERIAKKRAKRLAYKERRAVKKAEEEVKKREQKKEEQIEIQKEAYLRAMDIIRNENRGV